MDFLWFAALYIFQLVLYSSIQQEGREELVNIKFCHLISLSLKVSLRKDHDFVFSCDTACEMPQIGALDRASCIRLDLHALIKHFSLPILRTIYQMHSARNSRKMLLKLMVLTTFLPWKLILQVRFKKWSNNVSQLVMRVSSTDSFRKPIQMA